MNDITLEQPQKTASKSVAVLPFVNMSNDPEQEYISEGIAEEILNSLSNLRDLKVAGRSSSFSLDTRSIDLREVGEKLGVGAVLEGSVRRQGNQLRISVQLVNVEDGFHIWSEKYDRKMDDIFAIQDDIALRVTEKLKVTLLQGGKETIGKTHTRSTRAYELYLKGRFYINRRGPAILTGIQYFQDAFDADPLFAPAYAGYADANLLCALYGLLPPLSTMQKAKLSADKAIEIDPSLAEPYCSLGFYYACCEWNWEASEKFFLKALELNPRYAQAHSWYGLILLAWVMGDFEKAKMHGQAAIKAEPRAANGYAVYGAILHVAGEYKACLAACKTGTELDPYAFLCRIYEGEAYNSLKEYQDAINAFEQAMKISNNHHFALNGLISTYYNMGKLNKASVLMYELKERNLKHNLANAITGLSLGYTDTDAAIEFLKKALKEREPFVLTLKYENWISDMLKEDRRFQPFLKRIGFP
jgi:adenylate cyclase